MTPIQEEALRYYLQEAITPLMEQVLVKKLGQAMEFAAKELIQPKETTKKKKWKSLTEQQIQQILRFHFFENSAGRALIEDIENTLKGNNS